MSEEKTRSLIRKLAEIMGEINRIPKSGRNEFHKYDYATEADIVEAVRGGMAARHVMMLPKVQSIEMKDLPGGKQLLCTLRVDFTLIDGDSGEAEVISVVGQGSDSGDKASYKAMTGAEKYALLKLFLIPTGDDPETEQAPRRPATNQRPTPARAVDEAPAEMGLTPHPKAAEERALALIAATDKVKLESITVTLGELAKAAGKEGAARIRKAYSTKAAA